MFTRPIYARIERVGSHGMFFMPWVRSIVVLQAHGTQPVPWLPARIERVGSHGMLFMPWVRSIVVLQAHGTQPVPWYPQASEPGFEWGGA